MIFWFSYLWPERRKATSWELTSACAPAALVACGSRGTASRSTRALCSLSLGAAGCFRCAPPFSPTPPSAGHSAGRISAPGVSQRRDEALMWSRNWFGVKNQSLLGEWWRAPAWHRPAEKIHMVKLGLTYFKIGTNFLNRSCSGTKVIWFPNPWKKNWCGQAWQWVWYLTLKTMKKRTSKVLRFDFAGHCSSQASLGVLHRAKDVSTGILPST